MQLIVPWAFDRVLTVLTAQGVNRVLTGCSEGVDWVLAVLTAQGVNRVLTGCQHGVNNVLAGC